MCYAIRLDKMVPLSNVTKQGGSQSRTSSEMITVGDTGMQERAYDHASQAYREDILQKRREELMHGFWWSMNFKPIKRRFIMVAQVATPEDMGEIHKYEDPALHDENMGDRLATAKGWFETNGHSCDFWTFVHR